MSTLSMRKFTISILIALLLVSMLAVTVWSQIGATDDEENGIDENGVTILQSSINQQLPVNITLLVPTETGVQTVTVPLMLNLSLSVGPMEGIELELEAEPAMLTSPLTVPAPVDVTIPDVDNNDVDDNDVDDTEDEDNDEDDE
jgi:hypothetical protein